MGLIDWKADFLIFKQISQLKSEQLLFLLFRFSFDWV